MGNTINQHELQQFTHLELLAKKVVEGFITGLHKSPFHGFSVEFAEHRLYNKGESTKHIDWKLFGRTDKLFVKRFEEETNLRCRIIIDNSSSMYFPVVKEKGKEGGMLNKITFSVYATAALIYLLKKQRDAVGVSVFSDQVELHTAAKSTTMHHQMLFHELEKLIQPHAAENKKNTFATEAIHRIAESVHKRSLVIIFSDMMDSSGKASDELFLALQHLKHNKHEVILFHVTEKKKELDFDFEHRHYNFVDMETGDEVKVHPNEIKEAYISAVSRYTNELKLRCAQYKIDFVEADINEGFKQILLPYLLKRTRMQ